MFNLYSIAVKGFIMIVNKTSAAFSDFVTQGSTRSAVRELLTTCVIPFQEWDEKSEDVEFAPNALFQIKLEGKDYQLLVPTFSIAGIEVRLTRNLEEITPWEAMADGVDEVFDLVTDLMLVVSGQMTLSDVKKKFPQKPRDLY